MWVAFSCTHNGCLLQQHTTGTNFGRQLASLSNSCPFPCLFFPHTFQRILPIFSPICSSIHAQNSPKAPKIATKTARFPACSEHSIKLLLFSFSLSFSLYL